MNGRELRSRVCAVVVAMAGSDRQNQVLSTLYHAFRTTRRRQVIQFFNQSDSQTLTTREAAQKIASLEQDVPVQQATGEPYRNAYNALSQTHLPTLSEAGIIIYDPERQIVSRGVNFELAALLIDTNTPTVTLFSSLIDRVRADDR